MLATGKRFQEEKLNGLIQFLIYFIEETFLCNPRYSFTLKGILIFH